MIKFCIVLIAVVGAAIAKDVPECTVSGWGPWGGCERADSCPQPHYGRSSFPLAPALVDSGRAMMNVARKLKEQQIKEHDACLKDGSCPSLKQPAKTGLQTCINGYAGDYPCDKVDMLSNVNLDDLVLDYVHPDSSHSPRGNDIWGWTDPEDGHEYAVVGLSTGTSFVRVTDPLVPEVLAFLPTHTVASTWRDIKVVNNAAFIVSEAEDHGMQVFNLLRLRGMKVSEAAVVAEDVHYPEVGNSHNIVGHPETGYVYIVGATDEKYPKSCKGGLHVVDVRSPLKPVYAGCFDHDGYVHDAQCVIYHGPDTRYTDREVCFCYNEDSLTLVDVTDKNDMKLISKVGYAGYQYTHQGWVTEDHTVLLLDDELDEVYGTDNTKTYVWDVRDMLNPILRNTFVSPQTAIDHNQYILGDLTYQSNYGAGLRILHVDQTNFALSEVAYFDCYPAGTTASFVGTWSNYPYFASGNIIIDSIEFGLFVVRPRYDEIRSEIDTKMVAEGHQTRMRSIIHSKEGAKCPELKQTQQCKTSKC